MSYLILSSGLRKRVNPKDAIRVALAIKYPSRASTALREYVKNVRAIEWDNGEPPQQTSMDGKSAAAGQ